MDLGSIIGMAGGVTGLATVLYSVFAFRPRLKGEWQDAAGKTISNYVTAANEYKILLDKADVREAQKDALINDLMSEREKDRKAINRAYKCSHIAVAELCPVVQEDQNNNSDNYAPREQDILQNPCNIAPEQNDDRPRRRRMNTHQEDSAASPAPATAGA